MKRHERCRIGGSFGAGEIPLLSSFLYLSDEAELGLAAHLLDSRSSPRADPSRRQCQVGSCNHIEISIFLYGVSSCQVPLLTNAGHLISVVDLKCLAAALTSWNLEYLRI